MKIQPEMVALELIHPWDDNPRLIRDKRFEALCKSMEEEKDFLWCRPIIVNKNGMIIGGNMRYQAAKHLGWKEIPVSYMDVTDIRAKKLAVLDNGQFGEWDDNFATLLDELEKNEIPMSELGIDWKVEQAIDSLKEWEGMPEMENADLSAKKSIIVNFESKKDKDKFAKILGQELTDKTKSIWYPEKKQEKTTEEYS